jgi:hypothetical protein
MTEIYEIQGWSEYGYASIHKDSLDEHFVYEQDEEYPSLKKSVTKVYFNKKGYDDVFYIIVDENGIKIELEMSSDNESVTKEMDKSYEVLFSEFMERDFKNDI